MIKIAILLLICGLIIFIAYKFFLYYKLRHQMYIDLSDFCSFVQTEIGFLKNDISSIVTKYQLNCNTEFSKLLKGYLQSLNSNEDFYDCYNQKLSKLSVLKPQERERICNFFSILGKSDQKEQLVQIKSYKSEFDGQIEKLSRENSVFGAMSIKLGLLLSLAVFIIFI